MSGTHQNPQGASFDLDGTSADPDVAVQPEIRGRFVGRLDALQQLKKIFLDSKEERTLKVVTLVGDPGVGKTRLALEFSRSVRAAVSDTRVLTGSAWGSSDPSYAPAIRILTERFGIAESETPRDARAKIEAGVAEVMPQRFQTEVTHLLAQLMNFAYPASTVVEPLVQIPGQLEVRTYIAVRRFLEKDTEKRSLLLYFDGVERAGSETINLIHYLAEGMRNCPVFIMATARPTLFRRHPQWGEGEFAHQQIQVGPLNANESEALFTELVHTRVQSEELIDVPRNRLGGSPRAIEELARYLLEVEVIAPTETEWTVSADRLASLSIPRTHEETLRARFQALPPNERSMLERAAAIGEVFWLDAVVALVRSSSLDTGDPDGPTLEEIANAGDKTRSHVAGVLLNLCGKGLVTRSPGSSIEGEIEYRFAYPPIWDLVCELIDEEGRRRYHRLAAQWLELRPEGRTASPQEQAARHLERAGDGVMAAARYRRAADAARIRYRNEKAILLYTRALACLGEADPASRIHTWHDLGNIYELKGDFDSALDCFERMLRLSWVVASRGKGAVAFNKMGRVWRQKGNLDLALEYLERGLDLFRQAGDARGIATSLDDIGQTLWIMGRYEKALDRSAKALEMRRQLGDKRSVAVSLSNIGNIEKSRGLFDEAESCFREAMQLRKSVGDRYGYVATLKDLGALDRERGNLEQARDTWEDALTEADKLGALPLQMGLLSSIGEAAFSLGKVNEARQHVERAMQLATEIEDQRAYIEVLLHLTMIELKEGNTKTARQYAEECLNLAQQRQMRKKLGQSHMALGEIHAATLFDESVPDASKPPAENHFLKAIDVFRTMGNEAELAKALKRFGEYHVENGRMEEARETLKEAAEIFDRLGMRIGEDVHRIISDLG